jgi:hypothetical protein
MLGSCLPPVVCMGFMSFLRYLCVLAHSGVQHILCCVFLFLFVLCFVYPMLPVSLDCFCFCLSCVLCTLCCQFLWIIHFFYCSSAFPDVYLTVLWIFHPSQTGSTLQFEKHASQKQVVSFTFIPPTLSLINA